MHRAESITQRKVTEEDIREAERIETNPEMILRLIDLMFIGKEGGNDYPS